MRAKNLRLSWATLAIGVGLLELSLWAGAANYGRVAEPAARPVFLQLPPGAIEPAGWLRDWAIAAGEGITGHLDEYHAVYGDAWKGTPVKAPNAAADGTGWPLEQCSYWLDGLLRLGYVLHDQRLIGKATARLDLVVDGVNRGGTSFIYWTTNPPAGFNSWAHSQMGRVLIAYYQGTGQRRILDALLKVYRANAFRWLEEQHLLPYGVASGEEFLSGVGAFRLTETCDVAAMLWSSAWVYRITGEGSWGDNIERAFFNAAPAPIARDFQTMCYYQSPNRLEPESLPSQQPLCPGPGCLRFTRLGYPGALAHQGASRSINQLLSGWRV